ncbi:MAG: hypothetical protein A2539_04190 [Elusimicrobia bacterium RIFOXYD2_FULL_34_15]|nr:MAG: hypothetical protein A2539_04190 [Elusimicrobia bacterium RIFOXYD2_FULL_34_15]
MSTVKNILFFSILSFVFFFSSLVIPFVGIFFIPFSSASLIILLIKHGLFAGLIGIILSSLVIYKLTSFSYILLSIFLIFVALSSLILYFGIAKKMNIWKTILEACLVINTVLIIGLLVININGFQIPWIFSSVTAGLPKDLYNIITNILVSDIYSISIIFAITIVFLSYIYSSLISNKFNVSIKKLPPFEKWRLSEHIIFVLIFTVLFYGICTKLKYSIPTQIFENILYVIFFLYFMGGIAISKYFFGKTSFLLVIIYLIFFFYPPLSIFLGIIDIWLNFRKKGDSKNEDYLKTGS